MREREGWWKKREGEISRQTGVGHRERKKGSVGERETSMGESHREKKD